MVQIPTNYIHNIINFESSEDNNYFGYYFCNVFSMIDAKDKSQAYSYQEQINSDPDDVSNKFANYLKQILEANKFDISVPKMDIVAVPSENDDSSDTTEIIIWFLGVSAICAIGALILIICWRKFSGKDDNENENAINLEFLLDPNAPTMIQMLQCI